MKANFIKDSSNTGVGWGTWKWVIESSEYGLSGVATGRYTALYVNNVPVSAQGIGYGLNGWRIHCYGSPGTTFIDYGAILFSPANNG